MRVHPASRNLVGLLAFIGLAGVPFAAQTPGAADVTETADLQDSSGFDEAVGSEAPPETGATYGRLLHYEGGIYLRRDGAEDSGAVEVAVNAPVIPGDQIWTGTDGRAEIQLADGSLVRIDFDSRVTLMNLSDLEGAFDNTTLLRLLNGSLYFKTVRFDPRERRFQVDTPAGSIFALSEGVFRVDVTQDGASSLASYRGVAEVIANDKSIIAHSGERLTMTPDRAPGEARAFNTLRRDDFDLWSENRDDLLAHGGSGDGPAPEVPDTIKPYMSELNRNGDWKYDDEYGWVWVPDSVDTSWRPYYYGQWTYAPVGPVWVSYEPWGWAPYHYGRWSYTVGLGWFWSPGAIYSGAYVSWSVGPTYWGWCPVGYYDYPVVYASYSPWVYVPHTHVYYPQVHRYAHTSAYVAAHNVAHNQIILRNAPRIRPGYQLERTGATLYRTAKNQPSIGAARAAVGASTAQKVAFRQRENVTSRRIAARQLKPVSPRGTPASQVRSRSLPGAASVARPRVPAPGGTSAMRVQPISSRIGSSASAARSPVSGRPMTPSVKITPPVTQRSHVITPKTTKPPALSVGARPHPRSLPTRTSIGQGRFVMPTRPSQPPSRITTGGSGHAGARVTARVPASGSARGAASKGKSGNKGGGS